MTVIVQKRCWSAADGQRPKELLELLLFLDFPFGLSFINFHHLFIYQSICLPIYLSLYVSVNPSINNPSPQVPIGLVFKREIQFKSICQKEFIALGGLPLLVLDGVQLFKFCSMLLFNFVQKFLDQSRDGAVLTKKKR